MGRRALRWARRIGLALAGSALALFALAFVLREPADAALYPARGDAIAIQVVDHGYHAGLILPRQRLAEIAASRNLSRLAAAMAVFEAFDHVEIGWGEENFYRQVPEASLAALPHVVRALLNPANSSVLHVVGLTGDMRRLFPASDMVEVRIGPDALRRIAAAIDGQLRPQANGEVAPLGPGLYGPSAFFAARDRYHLLNTCNHWVGRVLGLAGLPYAPVESVISAGLMFDLRRRALPLNR